MSDYVPQTEFMANDPRPASGRERAYWNLLSHADNEIARLTTENAALKQAYKDFIEHEKKVDENQKKDFKAHILRRFELMKAIEALIE